MLEGATIQTCVTEEIMAEEKIATDSSGSLLGLLARGVGARVIKDTLSDLATNGECLEKIGAALYNDESDDAAHKPWHTLTVKEKRDWTHRASVAVLGLRNFILKKP